MAAAPDREQPFRVDHRFQVTWNGIWLTVACAVFIIAGVAMMLQGTVAGLVTGGLTVVLFGGGGLLAATAHGLSRRPVLELSDEGVCVVAHWPESRERDRRLRWDQVAAITAYTVTIPYRGREVHHHYLAFVPQSESGGTKPPMDLPEDARRAPGLDAPWELRHSAHIRSTWDTTVGEIVTEARRHRPDLPFEDRRDTAHSSSSEQP